MIKINNVDLIPKLFLVEVPDFMGEMQKNIGIKFNCIENGVEIPYVNLTVNFCEFIGFKCSAYIDTNNFPDAVELLQKGFAKDSGFTKNSGFCTYPLWVFEEDFLKSGISLEEYTNPNEEVIQRLVEYVSTEYNQTSVYTDSDDE